MSDDKAESSNNTEEDLVKLMDSALKDFKPAAKPKNTDDELDDLMAAQDQVAAQKAASDFQKMLEQMVQIQEEVIRKSESEAEEAVSNDDSKEMLDAIRQLMECSSNVANASSADEFMAGLEMLRSPDSPMEPFMSMIMQTLASKDVMYPPLKEIRDNFPKYMEEHRSELDQETVERYDKQYEILGKICDEFENQPNQPPAVAPERVTTDAIPAELKSEDENAPAPQPAFDDRAAEHFEKLGKLLVELQALGYPPKELVGALPEGWALDESGLPAVHDVASASESCSIM